ncbi:hypothetical protein ACNUDN_30135 [Mycobacterium sp. smrl_JER01]|uniref:hypothetical protein n=1 Tax=Mycobacterium sp. smrl_JER01 TaxID=3402633 RepID=UPI003AC7CEE8
MSSTTKNLDDLLALLEQMKADELAASYAHHMAFGQFADAPDPDDAECIATVLEGKLFSLSLADSYARETDTEFVSFTVNAVIMNAFRVWRQDYDRLIVDASHRLSVDPMARQQIRQELEENSRS